MKTYSKETLDELVKLNLSCIIVFNDDTVISLTLIKGCLDLKEVILSKLSYLMA